MDDLVIGYDRVTKELSDDKPRIVEGKNLYITIGGKLSKRPGLKNTGLTAYTVSKRPERLVVYETLENPPKVYLLGSFYSGGVYNLEYLRLDSPSPAWTSVGTLRDVQFSTRPHEILVARGLAFIKAYPDAARDKYASVIFDGSGAAPTLTTWGVPGPTVPARRTDPGTWAASANAVTVGFGWTYVYAWKTRTGQYSNRSDLEHDPAQQPSNTGAFTNKKPRIQVQGHPDTTNFPQIGIFRTTDGGGTFYHLEDIPNTGAGTITYEDNHRVSTTTNDPKQDGQLDTSSIAPSLTSNTVPPPVGPGKVIGTDQVQPSTPLSYFARRIWYAIGNRIYFSGQEEILNGVPEESFPNPNGIRGNYYVVKGQVRLNKETKERLYFITSNEVLNIRGSDRATLTINSLCTDIGAASGHPLATATFRDGLFFLSQDLQVYAVVGDNPPQIISEPLGNELRGMIGTGTEVIMETFTRDGNVWLLVAVVDRNTSENTTVFVFDLKRSLWFTPWKMPVSAWAFGRLRETDANKHLVVLTWNTSTNTGKLSVLDLDTHQDNGENYDVSGVLNLFTNPSGNHLNSLRQPAHFPMVSYLVTERTKFSGDTEPTVQYRLDEFSGEFSTGTAKDPPYSEQRKSYTVKWYPIQKVARRVQVKFSKSGVNEKFELQNVAFVFQPEAGT